MDDSAGDEGMTRRDGKVRLSVPFEEMISPVMARRLNERHGAGLPSDMISQEWGVPRDLDSEATRRRAFQGLLRDPRDFGEVTSDYLARAKAEGAVFVEVAFSPAAVAASLREGPSGHKRPTLDPERYARVVDAVSAASRDQGDDGVEVRMLATGSRRFGPETVQREAELATSERTRRPIVSGFALDGLPMQHPIEAFTPTLESVRAAGLGVALRAPAGCRREALLGESTKVGISRVEIGGDRLGGGRDLDSAFIDPATRAALRQELGAASSLPGLPTLTRRPPVQAPLRRGVSLGALATRDGAGMATAT